MLTQFYQHGIAFFGALILALAITPIVRKQALKRGIVDEPGGRRIHSRPIARMGGLAVFAAFWLTVGLVLLVAPENLTFIGDKVFGIDRNLVGVLLGAMVLLISGMMDDIKGLSPWLKLASHFLASLLVVAFGIKIWWIHNPITGIDIILGNWTYLIVPLWLVLVINVVNWLDGVDGLATGIGTIASIVIFLLSISTQVDQPATALLAIILAGSLLGFLPYNFNPAKIFLGDVGSMFIGFMLGIFAIISGGKFATAALVLGLPILDALWVVARRILSGKSPWVADRRHLHHRFLDAGFSQKQSVLFLYSVSALFGIVALGSGTRQKFIASLWLLGLMIVTGISLILIQIKRRNVQKEN